MLWHRAWEHYGNSLGKELMKHGGINSPMHDDLLVENDIYATFAATAFHARLEKRFRIASKISQLADAP